MPQNKGYCLVINDGSKYHAATVVEAVFKYFKGSLNPFVKKVSTKDYRHKFCLVVKGKNENVYGDTISELLTNFTTRYLLGFK